MVTSASSTVSFVIFEASLAGKGVVNPGVFVQTSAHKGNVRHDGGHRTRGGHIDDLGGDGLKARVKVLNRLDD